MTTIKLSKIEVVKRQLETAVKLYFQDEDIVAIHTIIGACRTILKDILPKMKGIKSEFEDTLSKLPKEFQKLVRDSYNIPQNFLKHADKDFDETIEFNPLITEMFIYVAINDIQKLVAEITPHQLMFRLWYYVQNSEKLGLNKAMRDKLKNYENYNKSEFYRIFEDDALLLIDLLKIKRGIVK